MTERYKVPFPYDLTNITVTGSTIQHEENGVVIFANEMLSPGAIICTWKSKTDYLEDGVAPSLPLLRNDRKYHLKAILTADKDLAVQLQLTFMNINAEKIEVKNLDDLSATFTLPDDAVAYEIKLLNLNHKWIKFDHLELYSIEENSNVDVN